MPSLSTVPIGSVWYVGRERYDVVVRGRVVEVFFYCFHALLLCTFNVIRQLGMFSTSLCVLPAFAFLNETSSTRSADDAALFHSSLLAAAAESADSFGLELSSCLGRPRRIVCRLTDFIALSKVDT